MIKFFRHIRQNLLAEGKTGKPALPAGRYFKYAIGEIVLVMIGILLALQINNWNESQKMNKWEHRFLIDLKNELEVNLNQLEEINNRHKSVGNACIELKSLLNTATIKEKSKIDSVYSLTLFQTTFFPTTGVYDSGLSAGKIENIKNDKLKYDIMNLYNHYYKRLVYNGAILDGVIGNIDLDRDQYFDRSSWKLKSWKYIESPEFVLKLDYLYGRNIEYTFLTQENVKEIKRLISSISDELAEND
ncbi:DUF6090 family protein [Lutimonas vermicola]|uniref:DUF6090 family protein n=1 Tax=Lutimonas vermicola TaxID=414288 RepID=A0ABU9L229_9FLAO